MGPSAMLRGFVACHWCKRGIGAKGQACKDGAFSDDDQAESGREESRDRYIPWCRALPEALVSPLADNALIKTIPLEHFPRDLFMIGRSLMILRGLTHSQGMVVQVKQHHIGHAQAM